MGAEPHLHLVDPLPNQLLQHRGGPTCPQETFTLHRETIKSTMMLLHPIRNLKPQLTYPNLAIVLDSTHPGRNPLTETHDAGLDGRLGTMTEPVVKDLSTGLTYLPRHLEVLGLADLALQTALEGPDFKDSMVAERMVMMNKAGSMESDLTIWRRDCGI